MRLRNSRNGCSSRLNDVSPVANASTSSSRMSRASNCCTRPRYSEKCVQPWDRTTGSKRVRTRYVLSSDRTRPMDRLLRHVRLLKGTEVLDDDFSMLELRMPPTQQEAAARKRAKQ